MGDTDGRELAFSLHSIDINGDQTFELSDIPEFLRNFVGLENAPNFIANSADPIKDAKVVKLAKTDTVEGTRPSRERYSGTHKSAFVLADILPRHIGTGEGTNNFQNLAKTIRHRGIFNSDDCGHIIAKRYGGKMLDFNLFPQNRDINRGIGIWSLLWKWGLEMLPRIWLIFFAALDPMVRIRMKLVYGNARYPDRPSGVHYHFEFYWRKPRNHKESEEEKRSNKEALRHFIRLAIYGEVPNECVDIDAENARSSMQNFKARLTQLNRMNIPRAMIPVIDIFVDEINSWLNPPAVPKSSPSSSTPFSGNKPLSFWDFVPVVGSLRTLDDAKRCADNGDVIGALGNTALGSISLGLDVLTIGTVSNLARSALKEGVKVGAKEAGKAGAKEGTKALAKGVTVKVSQQVLIVASEKIIEEVFERLAVTAATQLARKAIQEIGRI